MIILTDDEQATALRAARYALSALQKRKPTTDEAGSHARNLLQVELLVQLLEKPGVTNGVWRCQCPAWHQQAVAYCEKCKTSGVG